MKYEQLLSGTYIMAVSGGVDSVALLHALKNQKDLKLIVAHFDHGIRTDSGEDAALVKKLALDEGFEYIEEKGNLGAATSEETARNARYDFLKRAKDRFAAQKIITAHHADDIIETIILNLIRGTGWRGICSLKETGAIARPLLLVNKSDIIDYAKTHQLKWREDSTNADKKYLRNQIRAEIMPKLSHAQRQAWLNLYRDQLKLLPTIESELQRLTSNQRYPYIMLPQSVALEILKTKLGITRPQARRALLHIKTGLPGTQIHIGATKKLSFTRDAFVVLTN